MIPALADAPDRGQAYSASNSGWDGHSEWVRIVQSVLGAPRVKLVATLDYSQLKPTDAVLFFHPEVSLEADSLARFLNAGGRVAVFDDFGRGATLFRRFSIRAADGPLAPKMTLQGNPALPIAVPHLAKGADGQNGRHPVVGSADRVVTNHPVVLEHPALTALLEIDTASGPQTLALTGVIEGKGRLLVCGDSSVFLNLMLRYPGNRAFAEASARYLLERDTPNPDGVLYVLANTFAQRGDFGDEKLEEQVRRHLEGAIDELKRAFERGLPTALTTVLSVALVLWLVARLRAQGSFAKPRIVHGFAPGPRATGPTLGQGSRLEVLSAASTTPLLAVAELSEALDATLAEHLEGPDGASSGRRGAPLEAGELDRQRLTATELGASGLGASGLGASRLEAAGGNGAARWLSETDRVTLEALQQELRGWRRELMKTKRRTPTPTELRDLHRRTLEAIDSLTTLRKKETFSHDGPRYAQPSPRS